MTRIVGISLVRDEDLFVEQAVRNVLDFCDEVIVLEHRSIDDTPRILERLARESPKLRVHAIHDPKGSHDYVAGYAGEDVWIAGFDGDQLYDPAGLAQLRRSVLAGAFAGVWSIAGRMVHCVAVDRSGLAQGYHGPPSRGTPKLVNFGAITAWSGPTSERMHGGTIHWRPGFDKTKVDQQFQRLSWEETPFRALHLCFVPRSSRRPESIRRNPGEEATRRIPRVWLRETIRHTILRRPAAPSQKVEAYSRGPLSTVDARAFFREDVGVSVCATA